MAGNNTTKAEVAAYRFGMQRLELAVTTGRSYRRTLTGSRPSLSVGIGVGLAALTLAAFAIYGLIKPSPAIGSATVLIDTDTGGSYVVRDNRLYPAMNLASALLAAGSGASSGNSASKPSVTTVNSSTLRGMAKGQLLGIAGAPDDLPDEDHLVAPTWTVCDQATVDPALAPSAAPKITTTAILGTTVIDPATVGNAAVLVTPDGGKTEYVLWGGKRSRLATTDRAVALALGIDGVAPRPISLGLLNAIPEANVLASPTISDQGQSVSWSSDIKVGSVFSVQLGTGTADYVALSDGVEPVTPLLRDIIRASVAGDSGAEQTVSPNVLARAAVSTHPIDTTQLPKTAPTFYSFAQASVVCVSWDGATSASASAAGVSGYAVYPSVTLPLPVGARAVPAPPGSAAGSADAVYVSPGHGEVVGQVTGTEQAADGALFLITAQGVKYPVVSKQALTYLGLGKTIEPAPPGLLNEIPTGPTLDPAAASGFFGSATR